MPDVRYPSARKPAARFPAARFPLAAQGAGNGLLNNLVAYWKLDEASGTRVDSHGSFDLTDINTVGSTAGVINNAANFVGANLEKLSVTNNGLAPSGSFCFDLTFRASAISGSFGNWLINRRDTAGDGEFQLAVRSNLSGVVQFDLYSNGPTTNSVSGPVISTATTYHVYCQYDADANEIGISINNAILITQPVSGTFSQALGLELAIGGPSWFGGNSGVMHDGWIDECAYWLGGVLTEEQRTTRYNGGALLPYGSFTS